MGANWKLEGHRLPPEAKLVNMDMPVEELVRGVSELEEVAGYVIAWDKAVLVVGASELEQVSQHGLSASAGTGAVHRHAPNPASLRICTGAFRWLAEHLDQFDPHLAPDSRELLTRKALIEVALLIGLARLPPAGCRPTRTPRCWTVSSQSPGDLRIRSWSREIVRPSPLCRDLRGGASTRGTQRP